jgi:hypothetical protein
VYTKKGKQVSIDDVTLVIFERGGVSFIWMYGDWMPDMNNPQPPPNGFLLNEVSRILKRSNGRYVIEDLNYEVSLTDKGITFGNDSDALIVSARQGQIAGLFERVQ